MKIKVGFIETVDITRSNLLCEQLLLICVCFNSHKSPLFAKFARNSGSTMLQKAGIGHCDGGNDVLNSMCSIIIQRSVQEKVQTNRSAN